MESPSMPPLVDQPPFITPPQGATNGGQPGAFSASSFPWARDGPAYPPRSPQSAPPWSYAYTPWSPPPAASSHPPSWGANTPGGTWGAPSSAASYGPQTPAAYSPWAPPHQQQKQKQQQGGTWITPNMTPPRPHDGGAGAGAGGGQVFNAPLITAAAANTGYTGYPEGLGGDPPPAMKSKKHHHHPSSSSKRHHSKHERSPARPPEYRSVSWGDQVGAAAAAAGNKNNNTTPVYPTGGRLLDVPSYAKGDAFDERNLARRPLDWRPDYRPKLASYIPGLPKNRTDVTDYADPIRRTVHPLLHYSHNNPPIYDNLLESAFHTSSVEFLNLNRPHNEIDFAQLACQPSTSFLRLVHARLPWYIDVQQVHPNGITVLDVLAQMHMQLHTQIQPRHFYNEELTESDRAEITKAFHARCKGDTLVMAKGILQLDFLGDRVVFEGLSRAAKGVWELKLSRLRYYN